MEALDNQISLSAEREEEPQPFAAGNSNELDHLQFPSKRRWPFLVIGAVLGFGAAFVAVALLEDGDDVNTQEVAEDLQLATAPVEVRDLVEEVEWTAHLGYGTAITVGAPADGTVTAATAVGELVTRGDVLLEIDDQPVVVFLGDIPAWRNLDVDDEGPDVRQLETNLVALGYDPDNTVTIDDTYTANTDLMVERWQEDVGIEPPGSFDTAHVVVMPGPATVDTMPSPGDLAHIGSPLAVLSARARTTTVVGETTGEISSIAAVGDTVTDGTILYTAGGVAVMALTSLDSIGGLLVDPDADPQTLESALAFSGFDPEAAMVVDGVFDDATEAAVAAWQQDRGLPLTGQTTASAYVVAPDGLQVSRRLQSPGDTIVVARPVLALAAPTLAVTLPVGLADQGDFSSGQPVEVVLPDERVLSAAVTEVGTIAQSEAADQDPTVDVRIEITELLAEDLPASQVTVVVAGESVFGAMVVPTRALLTLSEGGFAVEKVLEEETTVLVAVETGTFDDGVVEVESSQLEPGDSLVVPQ